VLDVLGLAGSEQRLQQRVSEHLRIEAILESMKPGLDIPTTGYPSPKPNSSG
jgi:hypothetical protein